MGYGKWFVDQVLLFVKKQPEFLESTKSVEASTHVNNLGANQFWQSG